MMNWLGHIAQIREMRKAYKVLVEKPEGKRLLQNIGVGGKKPNIVICRS
jgi:hypothetical protein